MDSKTGESRMMRSRYGINLWHPYSSSNPTQYLRVLAPMFQMIGWKRVDSYDISAQLVNTVEFPTTGKATKFG